jgi:3-hydroxyisobutyrate dehydrogenase
LQRVALLGLGVMGSGMAGQLLKGGFPLTVYNRTAERAKPLEQQGAKLALSPREAAKDADVILAMVADDNVSRKVWLGEDGALRGAKRGAIAIDCSTLSPDWIRELAQAAKEHGCEFLDAPVTGSKPQAANGELLFLVGGEAAVLERARPVLKVMSRDIAHVGPVGSGVLVKLMNNYLCAVQTASLAEAVSVIERSGLDRDKALEILKDGAPGSPLVKTVSGRMAGREYDVNFMLHLMRKDLGYANAAGKTQGVDFQTGAGALKLFEQADEKGWGQKDFSSVVEALR